MAGVIPGRGYDLFSGVDKLAFEAQPVGAIGWVAGLVVAFPRGSVAIDRLMEQGRREEALAIYRSLRPLLERFWQAISPPGACAVHKRKIQLRA